jgi:hypothetical protein
MMDPQPLLRVTMHMSGPRVWICGRRVHHFWTGVALLPFKRTRGLGVVLIVSDWSDRAVWVSDLVRHPAWN